MALNSKQSRRAGMAAGEPGLECFHNAADTP